MYDRGVWEKLINMVMYTSQQGLKCWLEEIFPARAGVVPMVNIAGMRDLAVKRALDGGFEYVCLIDGDTLPEMDTLMRLLAHEAPMVGPYMVEPESEMMLGGPLMEPNQGLKKVQWICASLMLFKTSVFNCPGVSFKDGDVGDEQFFRNFWHYGHQPYIDTDTVVPLTKGPGRYGAWSWKDRWKHIEKMYTGSKKEPDRRPTDPDSPHNHKGVYAPFMTGGSNGHNGTV